MSPIELENLLREISPDAPSGENDLEHDPAFMELEIDIEGTPAVEVGDKVIQEAKDPDWTGIKKSALDLSTRTHDLRVAVFLTRAMLHTDGFQGLSDGLNLIHGYVEGYWDSLYPQLDPEDDNDPIERVNILEALTDWNMMIAPLMKVILCSSRTAGSVNLRQYRIAFGRIGELAVSDEEKKSVPAPSTIEGVFMDCDLDELQSNSDNVYAALSALSQLEALLIEKIGSDRAPDLSKLILVLREIDNLFKEQISRRVPSEAQISAKPGKKAEPDRTAGVDYEPAAPYPGGRSIGMVESREEVLDLLNQICTYYDLFEPASPVPLLLKRAMRLVEKNFFEIMEDLAPDSVAQIEKICGRKESAE